MKSTHILHTTIFLLLMLILIEGRFRIPRNARNFRNLKNNITGRRRSNANDGCGGRRIVGDKLGQIGQKVGNRIGKTKKFQKKKIYKTKIKFENKF